MITSQDCRLSGLFWYEEMPHKEKEGRRRPCCLSRADELERYKKPFVVKNGQGAGTTVKPTKTCFPRLRRQIGKVQSRSPRRPGWPRRGCHQRRKTTPTDPAGFCSCRQTACPVTPKALPGADRRRMPRSCHFFARFGVAKSTGPRCRTGAQLE